MKKGLIGIIIAGIIVLSGYGVYHYETMAPVQTKKVMVNIQNKTNTTSKVKDPTDTKNIKKMSESKTNVNINKSKTESKVEQNSTDATSDEAHINKSNNPSNLSKIENSTLYKNNPKYKAAINGMYKLLDENNLENNSYLYQICSNPEEYKNVQTEGLMGMISMKVTKNENLVNQIVNQYGWIQASIQEKESSNVSNLSKIENSALYKNNPKYKVAINGMYKLLDENNLENNSYLYQICSNPEKYKNIQTEGLMGMISMKVTKNENLVNQIVNQYGWIQASVGGM